MKYHTDKWTGLLLVMLGLYLISCSDGEAPILSASDEEKWRMAEANGQLVGEGLERCRHFVDGWMVHADSATGLIPRNIDRIEISGMQRMPRQIIIRSWF